MAIQSILIGADDTTLLEVPAGLRYAVTVIMICNAATPDPLDENANLTNFDLHFVKQGDPISDLNKVINTLQLPAGETFTFDTEKIILDAGDKIVLNGDSPTVLSATVSFLEL